MSDRQRAAERRRLRLLRDPSLAPHGDRWTYQNWLCRCAPCTEANTAGIAAWRAGRRVGEGTQQ